MTKEDALGVLQIAAAHHREIVELAIADTADMHDTLLDAGDGLDMAIVLAYQEGATLFELWKATRLPPGYLAALTNGTVEP